MFGRRLRLALLPAAVALFALVATSAPRVAGGATQGGFYLDLGASVAMGEQPTAAHPRGAPTSDGFAEDLVALEAQRGVSLRLVRRGCPGETTSGMLSGDGRCYDPPASQLAAAVSFLSAHRDSPGLVTLDIGFNDVHPCLRHQTIDQSCLDTSIGVLGAQLRTIVSALRAAAGPNVHLVGLGAYDPYLADWRRGAVGQSFAAASEQALARANSTMAGVYATFGIPMVQVAGVMGQGHLGDSGVSRAALEARQTCSLTWMCAPAPFGPNLHPNDHGYDAIAEAIVAALPAGAR